LDDSPLQPKLPAIAEIAEGEPIDEGKTAGAGNPGSGAP